MFLGRGYRNTTKLDHNETEITKRRKPAGCFRQLVRNSGFQRQVARTCRSNPGEQFGKARFDRSSFTGFSSFSRLVRSALLLIRTLPNGFKVRISFVKARTLFPQGFFTLIARGPCHRFRDIFAFSLHQRAETLAPSKWENKAGFFILRSLLVPHGRQNQPQAGDRSISEEQ